MRKVRAANGTWNICGPKIAQLRAQIEPYCSQRALADQLQLVGVDLGKNAIQAIESGNRTVSDVELKAIAQILRVTADELLEE